MTVVTTFPEVEFSVARVVEEEVAHAQQAVGRQRQSAVLTTREGVCTLTTVWA